MLDVPLQVMVLLGTLAVASLFVLSLGGVRLRHGLPLVDPVDRPTPYVHWISLTLVLLWIASHLLEIARTPVGNPTPPTIASIKSLCLLESMLFLALLIPLTYESRRDAGSY